MFTDQMNWIHKLLLFIFFLLSFFPSSYFSSLCSVRRVEDATLMHIALRIPSSAIHQSDSIRVLGFSVGISRHFFSTLSFLSFVPYYIVLFFLDKKKKRSQEFLVSFIIKAIVLFSFCRRESAAFQWQIKVYISMYFDF